MFGKKKKTAIQAYDKETQRPILRCSICTGEQVAGFKQIQTGVFEEVMLIRNRQDLAAFLESYGLNESELTKEY